MTCPGCQKPLKRHEIAQPMRVLGEARRPDSYCDACCKPWVAGSPDSLERLVRGDVDATESDRIRANLGLPVAPTLEPIGADIAAAQSAWKPAVPESLRPPFNS